MEKNLNNIAEDKQSNFNLLLNGFDTIQCAYYMEPELNASIDFNELTARRESIRHSKIKKFLPIVIGDLEFLLYQSGSKSGYPFIISNEYFKIEFGEFNVPNFFVTFPSQALWQNSPYLLHEKFIGWASSVGYRQYANESLSRVDYCFDYKIDNLDFDEDSFVSRSVIDSKYRENRKVQTFNFGKDDIVFRVYDKVAEIKNQSDKVWFFILWEEEEDVWRIEWQNRKDILKKFGIITFQDLQERLGILLGYLAEEHDTLRVPSGDSNRSRWPLHPLWIDLQENIKNIAILGVSKVYGQNASIDERKIQMIISMYGYMKRLAAIYCVQNKIGAVNLKDTNAHIMNVINDKLYEQLSWQMDIEKRQKEILLGEW